MQSKISTGEELATRENEHLELDVPKAPAIGGMHGEFGVGDHRVPWLKILQNVGETASKHRDKLGEIIVGEETFLTKPVELSFYGLHKKYQQNLKFDPASRPIVLDSAEEVERISGNLKPFIAPGTDDSNFIAIATAFVVAKLPKGKNFQAIDGAVEFNGGNYLPCMYMLRGTSYRVLVPALLTADGSLQKHGKTLAHARFSLDSRYGKVGANFIYIPVLKRLPDLNSDEFVEFVRNEIFMD